MPTPAQNPQGPDIVRSDEGRSSVGDLLARQAQLQGWIQALEANSADAPPHVVARVRSDYQGRLASLVAELADHRGALETDARRLSEQLQSVRSRREEISDELAEGRLRNRLGEWRDEDWEQRSAELDAALATATEEEQEYGTELSRLEDLLASIEAGGFPAAAPAPNITEAPAVESDLFSEPAADLPPAPDEQPVQVPPVETLLDDVEPDTRPGTGIKCPECGYTNDSTAWYCGVCGVDLA
jgi:hypothetical protein